MPKKDLEEFYLCFLFRIKSFVVKRISEKSFLGESPVIFRHSFTKWD